MAGRPVIAGTEESVTLLVPQNPPTVIVKLAPEVTIVTILPLR